MSRHSNEAAFLLHSTPWRETSLIVDLFTREHGRIAAVAKGARRPRAALRAALMQFQPLVVGFTGRNDLRILTSAEWAGGHLAPMGDGLLCAFYLNELLMRLLAREDPHATLWDAYAQALEALTGSEPPDLTLRRFEWQLLRETGYAPDLERDQRSHPIDPSRDYLWHPQGGFVAAEPAQIEAVQTGRSSATLISGETLRDLAQQQFDSARSRTQAKYLSRAILSHHLDGVPLHTRQILLDLQKT